MSGGNEGGRDGDGSDRDGGVTSVTVEPAPVPACPRCGEPVAFVVVTAPESGTVEPCGCGMPPDLLEQVRGG
ncbi:hypothetical protein [Natrinema salaciae]|uniref:Uncharacterized protein n=1 Tax=Natrinema salaciae TaxID=1186196 RepID=A0A1H9A1V0_9EURY|nr:hypothetical protein [Natrinema salaciae]SEP70457.1 hypothetical protein SAMN04489841_0322 [Natrinema salaciae]